MAVQVGGACYDTPEQASQVTASTQAGQLVSGGSGLYSVSVVATSGTSIEYAFTSADGAPAIPSVVVPFNAQPCNLLDWSDGMELGWAIVACYALAFGVKFLAKQIRA